MYIAPSLVELRGDFPDINRNLPHREDDASKRANGRLVQDLNRQALQPSTNPLIHALDAPRKLLGSVPGLAGESLQSAL